MILNDSPLWTALITPMLEDGSIDHHSLHVLVKEQEKASNALLVLGSTGESLNLSEKERKEVLESVLKLSPTVPIMVGIGGSELEATKEWLRYLETKKVDAYLMVTPLYAKPESKGQTLWFKELMDLSTRPVMLYNVPSRTGKSLSFETVKELSTHPSFWAIKEASGSVEEFKRYKKSAPNAKLFSGDDALTPSFAQHGCHGLVSVASNVWPQETRKFVIKSLQKDLTDDEIELWAKCSNALFIKSNPIPAKSIMAIQKRIQGPYLKLPLSHHDLEETQALKEADQKIKLWSGEK